MMLHHLKQAMASLASDTFCPGTPANHARQAQVYIRFCDNYHFHFINPSVSTMCFYITHLTTVFSPSNSVCTYAFGVRFIHKKLSLAPEALNTFPVHCLVSAADLTMRTPPHSRLPILPHLLDQLSGLSSCLGFLGPAMKLCLTFGFLWMLRQSNLAPPA